ncbi:MAG: acyltransferase family protein [Propionibacteriaceae bacterium]
MTSTTARPRVQWIDTGRGLAIVLVALYHAARWLSKAGFDTAGWQLANEILSSLRMPLFFALAGLFAGKWLRASWRDLVRAKVVLFAWVFFIWETIGSIAFVLGTATNGHRVSLWDTGISLLISPLVPKLELWFIWALTLFFVLAKLTRAVPVWVQLGITALVSATALTLWLNTTTGATGSAKYYFFFLAGIYLRELILKFGSTPQVPVLVVAFVAWGAVSFSLSFLGLRGVFGLYFLNCVLGVIGGIAVSRVLTRLPVLHRIGTQTLPIYLAHTPIIIVISFLLSLTPLPDLGGPDILATPLLGVTAVTLALLLYGVCQHNGVLRYLYAPPLHLFDQLMERRKVSVGEAPVERP